MSTFSKEHIDFLKKRKREQKKVTFFRIIILICFLGLWELAAQQKWLNTFLSSSPSLVVKTIYGLFLSNDLWQHSSSVVTLLKRTGLQYMASEDMSFSWVPPSISSSVIFRLKAEAGISKSR